MSGIDHLLDSNVVNGLLKGHEAAIRLRRAGLLKLPDAIVAGCALATGARLLTLDQRLARVHADHAAG